MSQKSGRTQLVSPCLGSLLWLQSHVSWAPDMEGLSLAGRPQWLILMADGLCRLSVGAMLGLSTPGPTCSLSSTMVSQDHLVGQLVGWKMVLQPFLENRMCQSHLLKAAKLRGMSLGPLTVKIFNFQNSSLGSISESRWAYWEN